MRHLYTTGCGLLLLAPLWAPLLAPALASAGEAPQPPVPHPVPPLVPPGGPDQNQVCATGCAAAPAAASELSRWDFEQLIATFAAEPLAADSPALEELLFKGAAAREWIDALAPSGLEGLDAEHAEFLRGELARTHARLSVRVVDESGSERFALEGVRLPLAEKQHLFPERALDLQVPEISGTVQRVGVNHLWTRL